MTTPRPAQPGDRHGKLVILSIGEPGSRKRPRRYEVRCDCGTVNQFLPRNWGHTVSCGCAGGPGRQARLLEIERRDRLAAALRWGGAL